MASHTINYGHIIDPEDEVVEEVMVAVTKDFYEKDIVEINCHGGLVTVNRVLELTLSNGARMAEPGEFTKRADVLTCLKQKRLWISYVLRRNAHRR